MSLKCRVVQWVYARSDLVSLVVIVGAVFVLLAPWLLDVDVAIVSPTELGTDFITKQWPNATYIVQAWQHWGEVPRWRTSAMGGVPIVGNPSMLLAYPPYWLIFLFPIGWAFTLYFAFHLVWAGWGVYGLARRVLTLSPGAALLAALAFSLSAKAIAHLGGGHIDVVAALAWLPWLWWSADRLARAPGWLSVAGTAVAVAAQALTHLPTLWLSVLPVGFWGLSVLLTDREPGASRRWLRAELAGLAALTLAAGLSAVQVCPMLELLPFSTRGAMTLSEASQYALPVPLLIGLLLPTALAFPEWVVYAGVVTLALVPASWLARDLVRGWRFLVILVLVGTVLSLGCATPLYSILFRVVPGMNWLRVPSRVMFLVQLALSLLAGMGWDGWGRAKLRRSPAIVRWWIALALLVIVGAAWTRWFPGVVAVSVGGLAVAMVVLLVLLLGHSRLQTARAYISLALAVLVVAEAVVLAPHLIARERVSALTVPAPVARFLTEQPGHFRAYSPRGLVSMMQAVAYELETVDGNDPFQFGYYVRWVNAASGCDLETYSVSVPACAGNEVDPQAYLRAQPDGTLLGVGNTRYVVTDHVLRQWSSLTWQSGAVRVYDNPAVLPRAFVVPEVAVEADDRAALMLLRTRRPTAVATVPYDPQGAVPAGTVYHTAQVVCWTSNSVEMQADGPGWLVVSQVWAPGWQAFVDGVEAQVYRTDVAFCGLPLTAGFHEVTLMYEPTGWMWGRWVSLGTVVLMVAVTVVAFWRRRTCFPARWFYAIL
jgi:hypothetical protein